MVMFMIKDKGNVGIIGSLIFVIGIFASLYFIFRVESEKVYRTMTLENNVATFIVDQEVYTRIAIINEKLEYNPDPPEKENYIFDYWDINGKKYDENTKLKEDTTINAVFKKVNETSSTTISNPTNTKIQVTGINIDKTSVNLNIGESITLKGTIIPNNATNQKISWLSSNSSIVIVDAQGKITGVGNGTSTITARSGNGKEAKCTVVVKGNTVAITKISLDKKEISINKGDSLILNSEITPENASNKTVSWISSNQKIVEVTESGKITGKSAGNVTITVRTNNGKEAKCNVTVIEKTVAVESVSLDRTNVNIDAGKEITITASIKPDNATNKNITWQSSNTSVAKVSNGKIIGVGSGTATITAIAHNGKGKECQVTVNGMNAVMATSISLNSVNLSMTEGDRTTLKATVNPSNTTDKTIIWTSSNTKSVIVDKNGAVSAISIGESTITAKVGSVKTECRITVYPKEILPESILIKPTNATITVGSEIKIESFISPSNTTDKTVIWTSNDKTVATVNNSGVVKGIKKGTTTITATTKDGNKKATATIKVEYTTDSLCTELIKGGAKSLDYKTFIQKFPNSDDYYAIYATHACANKYSLPVVVTKGEYHIYKKTTGNIVVKTNTNLNNSTIYIHDEDGIVGSLNNDHVYHIESENCSIKTMKFTNLKYNNTVTELSGSINGKYVKVTDNSRKVYIRYGTNSDSGMSAIDSFRVDKNGKVLDPLFWDYNNKNVSVYMCDIPSSTLTFQNANFYSIVDTKTSKSVKSSSNSIYLRRGIYIGRSNVNITNINHKYIDSSKNVVNTINHGYYGFFNINNAANINLNKLKVHATKNNNSNANSTYDIIIDSVANITIKNVYMTDYDGSSNYYSKSSNQMKDNVWGVVGTNDVKNITYDGCVLNRIDTHRGAYNETIKNTTIGVYGINAIGAGNLNIENVTGYYKNNLITLRSDYGGVWNGNINIKNSKIYPSNNKQVFLISVSIERDSDNYVHNFGYDLRLPTINISDFTIHSNIATFYIYNQSYSYFSDAREKGIKNSTYTFDFPKQNYIKNIYDENGKELKTLNYYGT